MRFRSICFFIGTLVIAALLSPLTCTATADDSHALPDPYGIEVFRHVDFVGDSMSYRIEFSMRIRLVPVLPNWLNDTISSLRLGYLVSVMVFKHANFSGPSAIYDCSHLSIGWMNDTISSFIIFPRALDYPPGGHLREDFVYGDEECQFFPVPELLTDTVALYPTIADNVNDESHDLILYGDQTNVDVYEHANFGGNAAHFPGPANITHASLEDYQLRERVSSVRVTWNGPWPYGQVVLTPMVAVHFAYDLRGMWKGEFGSLTYQFTQDGNQFSWYVETNRERGTGTINGTIVSVAWAGDWGSGSDTGTLIPDRSGRIVRIEWDNGNTFTRL